VNDVCRGSRAARRCCVGIATAVPQIAVDLLRRRSWQSRANCLTRCKAKRWVGEAGPAVGVNANGTIVVGFTGDNNSQAVRWFRTQAPAGHRDPAGLPGWRIYKGIPLPPDGVLRKRAARLG
jgi:hypothetical protein